MKAVLLCLMFAAAFGVPVPGQGSSASRQDETAVAVNDNSVTADANQSQTASTEETSAVELGFPTLRILGGLGLVLSLIIVGYFAARKFAPQYFSKLPSERNLKVIETLPMGEKRSVSLIQVENKRFLVGNTPQQITLLAPMSDSMSLVSEPEVSSVEPRSVIKKERMNPFQNLFEAEKNRSSLYSDKPKTIPEDIRMKMRQLREALER
jgi:flagellar biosynthetic protein FliO